MSETRQIQCPDCARKFAKLEHMAEHARAKHAAKSIRSAGDDDESFASRALAASLDHAMGVENEDYDWLVEPFE